nr:hypothetical protein [Tanacetum cinerariifolium]
MNHVGESGDFVTEIVSKGDTLTTKIEKTKASIQVTQENKKDDMVMEDEKIMCLGILDYGVYGMKNNASTIKVLDNGVVDVYDDVGLEIQTAAAETFSCSLPTVVGANEHTIRLNEGCTQKGVCLFGRCCDLKHVEGLIDKEKGCNKDDANGFDVCNNEDTSYKVAICYDYLWKYEKHKEKLIRNQSC